MILTVTPNTALDVTYRVDQLVSDGTHRARSVDQRAGGKGVNVARVLRRLGHAVRVVGPVGGSTGEVIRADLAASGLDHRLVGTAGESRRTVTIVSTDTGSATTINEPGPALSDGEWDELVELVRRETDRASAVVFGGSLPQAVPVDGYAELVALATSRGVPAVLDTSGPALRAGLTGGPDLVKPNADELRQLSATPDPVRAAMALRDLGARDVVVSLGQEGLLAVTGEGCWDATPSDDVVGNPTGAGDALVAALTSGLVRRTPWPERLREAVAVSSAAVAAPLAGDFADEHYRQERSAARVRAVDEREVGHVPGTHG